MESKIYKLSQSRLKLFIALMALVSLLIVNCVSNVAAVDSKNLSDNYLPSLVCSFSGKFTQTLLAKGVTVPVISSGSLFYDCELGLVWATKQPVISTKILTFEGLHYQLDRQGMIKSLDNIPESLQAKLLLSIFGRDDVFIDKHFDIEDDSKVGYSLVPQTKTYQRGLQKITLSMNTEASDEMEIKILDSRDQLTTLMILQDQVYDGDHSSYEQCQLLYTRTEYCNILKNPIHYQEIND